MAIRNIQIDSIYNGQSPSYLLGGDYLSSIAIDPDANVSPIINKISGAISPTSHESFLTIDGNPLWIKPNPKNDVTFTYTDTGKIYRHDKDFETVGSVLTLTNSSGNGLSYYNGYYYAFKNNNLDRITPEGTIEQDYLSSIKNVTTLFNPRTTDFFFVGIGGSNVTTKTAIAFRIPEANLVGGRINKIKFPAKRSAGSSGTNIKLSFVEDDSDNPTGAVVGTPVLIPYNSIPTTQDLIELNVNFSFNNNTDYWLKIEADGTWGVDELLELRRVNSSAYAGLAKDFDTNWNDIAPITALQFILTYEENLLPELQNKQYPLNGTIELPNHVAHVHNDTLYYANVTNNTGFIETIKTITEMEVISVYGFFTLNQVITGEQSRASATIVLIEDNFTSTNFDVLPDTKLSSKLGIVNITGEFIPGERVGTLDTFGRINFGTTSGNGTIRSVTQGKMYDRRETGLLQLPIGMLPVAIESFGSDIAVLAIQTTDNTVNQGESRLYLWDRFDVSFYREIRLPYAIATSLLTHNGIPYLWGGDDKGYSFAVYVGGDQVQELFYIDDGKPPFAGAVVGENNRILWGSNLTYPETAGVVHAWGSRNASLPKGLHTIARSPNNEQVTALSVGTINEENIIIGSDDMLAKSGGELHSVFRSKVINVGKNFTIKQITLPLSDNVDEDTEITVSVFVDNESRSKEVITIDETTYSNNKVVIYPEFTGENNFFVELKWSKTKKVSILLPITVKVEVMEE